MDIVALLARRTSPPTSRPGLRPQRAGSGLVEYALLLALIAVVCIVGPDHPRRQASDQVLQSAFGAAT